jgi:hypothetical protein
MTTIQTIILFLILLALLVWLWFQETETKVLNTLLVWALILLFLRLLFSDCK